MDDTKKNRWKSKNRILLISLITMIVVCCVVLSGMLVPQFARIKSLQGVTWGVMRIIPDFVLNISIDASLTSSSKEVRDFTFYHYSEEEPALIADLLLDCLRSSDREKQLIFADRFKMYSFTLKDDSNKIEAFVDQLHTVKQDYLKARLIEGLARLEQDVCPFRLQIMAAADSLEDTYRYEPTIALVAYLQIKRFDYLEYIISQAIEDQSIDISRMIFALNRINGKSMEDNSYVMETDYWLQWWEKEKNNPEWNVDMPDRS